MDFVTQILPLNLCLFSLLLAGGGTFLRRFYAHHPVYQSALGLGGVTAARFIYYLGIPYLALIGGLIPSSSMGLIGLDYFIAPGSAGENWAQSILDALGFALYDWMPMLGVAIGISLGTGLLFFILAAYYRRQLASLGAEIRPWKRLAAATILFDLIHLAFYRALILAVIGDLQLSNVLAIAFFLIEIGLFYRWLKGDTIMASSETLGSRALLSAGYTFLFPIAPNLWLAAIAGLFWSRCLTINIRPMR